jgi:hypothetical protein
MSTEKTSVLNVEAQTEKAGQAFKLFVNSQKENISDFINTIIAEDGTPSDAAIKVDDNGITLYQFAPDKGIVLAEQPEGSTYPVQVARYSELPEYSKYLMQDKEFLMLCVKTKDGKPDGKLGRFKSLNDAVLNFNTEGAKLAFKNWSDKDAAIEKRETKQEAKLLKMQEKANKALEQGTVVVDAE